MKVTGFLLSIGLVLTLTGCQQPSIKDKNILNAGCHATAEVIVAATLGSADLGDFPVVKDETVQGLEQVIAFIETHKVSEMTGGVFRKELDKLLSKYVEAQYLTDTILAALGRQQYDVESVLGEDGVMYLLEACNGALSRAKVYDIALREEKEINVVDNK